MPNIWKNKIHVPNHQPDNYNIIISKYTWQQKYNNCIYMYIYHEIRCNYISTYDILERMQKEYYESPSLTFWKTNRYTSVTSPFNNGWLMVYLPLWKYDFVSWDDDIPNIWKNTVIKMFQSTNQIPDFMTFLVYVWNHRPVMAKHILILIIKSHKSHVPEHQPVTIVNGFIMVYKPTITNI